MSSNLASYPRLARKIFLKKHAQPEVITLFATHRCNASCSFCFFADSLNKPVDMLSLDEWQRVAQSIAPFSLLILTGGEPFLNNQLAEIARSFIKYSKVQNISVPTNGSYPDKIFEFVDKVLSEDRLNSLCISFSIDALKEKHDELRRLPGSFASICQSLSELKQKKEQYGDRLIVHTASVYSAETQDGIEPLLNFIETELQPDSMGLTLVRAPAEQSHFVQLDGRKYLRLNQQLASKSVSKQYSTVGSRLHHAKAQRVVDEQINQRYVSPCYAGQINAVILADGTVPLCENRSETIGSLRDFDFNFKKLWASPGKHQLVAKQKAEKCFCGHECFVTPNIAFNAGQLLGAVF